MAVYLSLFAGAGQQFFTNAGVPLAGGKIYTYGAGGSTPQATYTTSAGNIAHSNPIVLDAAGRVPGGGEIWLTDTLVYKFVLETSAGVTVQTLDNVSASIGSAALVASSGSSLIGFIQAGSGAVARTAQSKMRDIVSVKDFGAVGDGVANDTSAIQAALNAHKNVHFSAGTYKITSALILENNHCLTGDGMGVTTVNQVTIDQYATSATSKTEILISGITWNGTNSGVADGLYFTQCTYCVVELCEVNLFGHNGINFFRSSHCQATANKCAGNRIGGINVGGTTASAAEYNRIIGNSCIGNSSAGTFGAGILFYINANYCVASHNVCNDSIDGYGILVTDSIGTVVNNNACKGNQYSGLTYHYDSNSHSLSYNLCDGNLSQGNGEHGIVFQSNTSLFDLQIGNTISNNQCIGNGNYGGLGFGKGIYVASGARGFNITGNNCQLNYESGIEVAANVGRGEITNNVCHNNGVGALASRAGIRLNDTSTEGTFACTNILVSGNHCDDVAVGNQQYGVDVFTSNIQSTIVVGNSLRNNTIAPYRNNGTDTYIEDFLSDGTQNIVLANLRLMQISAFGAGGLNFTQDRSTATNSSRLMFSTSTAGQSVTLMNENNAFAVFTGGTPGAAAGTQRLRCLGSDGAFVPGADNTQKLGNASFRWSEVFAGNGTINTSDERRKSNIMPIDAKALAAWAKVEYAQFKFVDAIEKKGDKARWHFGLIAQRVKEAFESEGLDAFAYGILCYDEWDEEAEIKDDQGNITRPRREAGNIYGIRYEQALALECAYLRSKVSQ